jgi:hypothetical protein
MSSALGWLAVALASLGGPALPEPDSPDLIYAFKVMEVRGLQWRARAGSGLKPVTSRGGVTVWTAPRDFFKSLPEGTVKAILAAPRITAFSQAGAHLTTRKSQPFVTQVAWRGEGSAPRSTTETVREGLAATIAGRWIDQGALVRLVIEDTDVRSVHTLDVPGPKAAAATSSKAAAVAELPHATFADLVCNSACDKSCPASGHAKTHDAAAQRAAWHAAPDSACCADDHDNAAECHAARSAGADGACSEMAAWKSRPKAQVQVPEVGRAEIAGEWLVPRDEVLLVAFGPHTIADTDGKAVVRERLAAIAVEEAPISGRVKAPEDFVVPKIAAPAPAAPMPHPTMPSRTLPQGVHADGSPAELPPLPDDEKAGPSPGDSSEPRPSPQTKKPKTAPAPPATKPAATSDSKAAKAAFDLTRSLFKQAPITMPQLGVSGLQFMMPLKPFAMKLPFNQKLELELIGKVVPDTEAAAQGGSDDD